MRALLLLALLCFVNPVIAQDLYYGDSSPVIVSNYGHPLLVTSYPTYPVPVAYYNWPVFPEYQDPASLVFALPSHTLPLQLAGSNAVVYWSAAYLPQATSHRAPLSSPNIPATRTAEAVQSSTLR
jgi:hypothetical protein